MFSTSVQLTDVQAPLTVSDDVVLEQCPSLSDRVLSRGCLLVVHHPSDQVTATDHVAVDVAVHAATVLQTRPCLNQSTTSTRHVTHHSESGITSNRPIQHMR